MTGSEDLTVLSCSTNSSKVEPCTTAFGNSVCARTCVSAMRLHRGQCQSRGGYLQLLEHGQRLVDGVRSLVVSLPRECEGVVEPWHDHAFRHFDPAIATCSKITGVVPGQQTQRGGTEERIPGWYIPSTSVEVVASRHTNALGAVIVMAMAMWFVS